MLFLDKFIHHPLIFPSRLSLKGCNDLVHIYMLSCFNHVQFFATLWTVACQILCPWDSPDKNTGVGFHALLQGIFLAQGLNLGLLSCRQFLYHWATRNTRNDLSLIYSFRAGILHLGDFAPKGHICRCCYQHHWGEVLLTCDKWRLNQDAAAHSTMHGTASWQNYPTPRVSPTRLRNPGLESGQSASQPQEKLPLNLAVQ